MMRLKMVSREGTTHRTLVLMEKHWQCNKDTITQSLNVIGPKLTKENDK